jgi:hypothetical protein
MPELHLQLILERAYAHRRATGSWPTREMLQRALASEHIDDVHVRGTVMQGAPYVSFGSGEEVRPTSRGLALVPDARPLLESYLRAVHVMIERYRDQTVEARYTARDLETLGLDQATQHELAELLRDDGWALGTGGDDPALGWAYEISDTVLLASDATTVEELVAIRSGEPPLEDAPAAPEPPEPLRTVIDAIPALDADRPISHAEDDLLERAALGRVLAAQATSQVGHGFVIGVSGPWGSGKTSLLNLMASEVIESESGYVVRFDPWLFSSSEELVLRFLREISAQLGRDGRLGDAALRIGEYAQILAPIGALAGAPWLAPPLAASGALARRRRKTRADVSAQDQRERVADALRRLDRRLVVLIDDLDRLQADEVRDVMRLVKLVGDFPNTTYVLAYDHVRIAQALGDGAEGDGEEFLEKIVQLTLEVPSVDAGRLTQVLSGSISAAVGDLGKYTFDDGAYATLFSHARPLFSTLRDVRRYTNVLPGTLALVGEEVELADVLALEALRVRAPASFAWIVLAKRALTQPRDCGLSAPVDEDSARRQVEAIVDAAGEHRDEVAGMIKCLFPAAARHLGGSNYGSSWLASWRQGRRVAHHEVLEIYLNKALPAGVLPVALVERAFESLEDADALSGLFGELDDEQLEALLDRLEHYEPRFPTDHVEVPVSVLYNHQWRMQRQKRHVFDLGAEHKVGRIALRMLRKLDAAEALSATQSALTNLS